jgi:hypothetical protein
VCVKLRSKSSVQAVRYKVLVIWQADRIKVLNDGTDELAMSRVVPPSKVAFLEEKILVAKAFNQRIEEWYESKPRRVASAEEVPAWWFRRP